MHKYAKIRCSKHWPLYTTQISGCSWTSLVSGLMFENLLVTGGLRLLVHIHTETHAVNHCGCSTVLLFGTRYNLSRKLFFVLGRSLSQSSCNFSWFVLAFGLS